MSNQIAERSEYISLMKSRALGEAPEMGSAIRMAEIICALAIRLPQSNPLRLLDIGCAAGHYLRSIITRLPASTSVSYIGIDIDDGMISVAREAWASQKQQFPNLTTEFHRCSVEEVAAQRITPVHISFCANAFMYFSRPQMALENMLPVSLHHCVIRSYFWKQTFIIKRAQPIESHPESDIHEQDILDERGEPRRYDLWNIYSESLLERLVEKIDASRRVSWEEDNNKLDRLAEETASGIEKFGATQVWGNQEVVYPFILPWKYAIISKGP